MVFNDAMHKCVLEVAASKDVVHSRKRGERRECENMSVPAAPRLVLLMWLTIGYVAVLCVSRSTRISLQAERW